MIAGLFFVGFVILLMGWFAVSSLDRIAAALEHLRELNRPAPRISIGPWNPKPTPMRRSDES